LQQEFDRLKAHVLRNETKIKSLERKLKRRQDKRKLEAVLTNMTPSERAEHIEKELKYMQDHDGEEEKEPEMDMLL
jgi:hypothetical protein